MASRAERLRGKARFATFDDATPNSGTVVFVDDAGVTRTLDVVSAPFGLDAKEVHATALPVQLLDDAGAVTDVSFYVLAVPTGFFHARTVKGSPRLRTAVGTFSRTTPGWRAAIRKSASAAPSGFRRSCSQLRSVCTLMPRASAN
jgi:hypothetical protein